VPPPLPAPGIAVNLTSTSDGANRTSTATVRGTTVPGTICVITVTEASGQPPPAGLGPKTADGAGAVIWSWSATTARVLVDRPDLRRLRRPRRSHRALATLPTPTRRTGLILAVWPSGRLAV